MATKLEQIGPYHIDREIGRGGMGVVYLGRDTRLDRDVAIKALPEHLAKDYERLARFEREAKMLAQLSHPNVAGIHGVEEQDNTKYLVLEYVEGPTLAERLDHGALPVDEAIALAIQIAAGIEAAHEAGVIHRDLKPGNVIVTAEGQAKVLDFGLARAEEGGVSGSSVSQLPTITTPPSPDNSPTTPGAILGTAPYMSPEQARGRRVDKRTDIWSFGVILYEMLTGVGPFIGETVTDSIGAILHKDVDLTQLPMDTPAAVQRVLRQCLVRDKSMRMRDIGDVRIELTNAGFEEQFKTAQSAPGTRTSNVWVVVALLVLLASYASWSAWFTPAPSSQRTLVSSIMPPEGAKFILSGDVAGPPVLSRDGFMLALTAKESGEEQKLYIRSMDGDKFESIHGTDGAMFPFWSWDGRSVGYFANGQLRRYDLATRTNHVICDALASRGGAWLADNTIVFSPNFQAPIFRVSADGGDPTAITTIDSARHASHRWPRLTPDGMGFVYSAVHHMPEFRDESAIFLHQAESQDIEVTRAQYPGQIVSGNMLVLRDGTLYASPFNSKTGRLSDSASVIAENVFGDLTTWHSPISAAESGELIYVTTSQEESADNSSFGAPSAFGEARRMLYLRRDGSTAAILADGVPQNTASISPNQDYVAISAAPEGPTRPTQFDIWLYTLPSYGDVDQQRSFIDEPARRLTFLDGVEMSPQWSPDGVWIVYGFIPRSDGEPLALQKVRTSGGQPETVYSVPEADGPHALMPTDWSSDGRYIVFSKGSWLSTGSNDLYALDLETNETFTLVENTGDDMWGRLSPDGKWLAYQSSETGAWEVYVVPFMPGWEEDKDAERAVPKKNYRWRISIAGGGKPQWKPDGGELYYISASGSMMAVQIGANGAAFTYDAGVALFDAPNEAAADYDVNVQGERFTINRMMIEDELSVITLLTNWQSLLRK